MKLYKIIFVMQLGYFVNIPDVPEDKPPTITLKTLKTVDVFQLFT